jgi:hypothetical protein
MTLSPHLLHKITNIRIDGSGEMGGAGIRFNSVEPWVRRQAQETLEEVQNNHMAVSAWASTCAEISRMRDLRKVTIILRAQSVSKILHATPIWDHFDFPSWAVNGSEILIMKPLEEAARRLGNGVNFEVIVDWPRPLNEQDWVEGAFVLIRTMCITCQIVGEDRCFSHVRDPFCQ